MAKLNARPFAVSAPGYRARGWRGTIPLPASRKAFPPAGFTGHAGRYPTDAEITAWAENGYKHGNIAIRLPDTVVGIDVDAYKRGGETLRKLEDAWGPLPTTWRSTSRPDDSISGIRWFRVPQGTKLAGVVEHEGTSDIEVIQRHHRYAVVAPSIHPSGRLYTWFLPDGSQRQDGGPLPTPDDFPDLPEAWREGLRQGQQEVDVDGFLDNTLPDGEPCLKVRVKLDEGLKALEGGSRNEHANKTILSLVRLGERQHPGVKEALGQLREAYVKAVLAKPREDRDQGEDELNAEVDRMIKGAVRMVTEDPTGEYDRGCHCTDQGEEGVSDATELSEPQWPDPLPEAAYHGVAGEIVRAIEPHTEADPAAVLIQLLVGFGNMIGRSVYWVTDGVRHYTNLFAVQVGDTSVARKGTSWGRVRQVLEEVDPIWASLRVMGGLSSGEGLINEVRDDLVKHNAKGEEYTIPGVEDKRLLAHESEFSSVLKQAQREKNILGAVLRQAWETGHLRNMTVDRRKATGAHISVNGHITAPELMRLLTETEAANGFGNRFLWYCGRRSKLRPRGGGYVDLSSFVARVQASAAHSRSLSEVGMSEEAWAIWDEVYGPLSMGRPGLFGAMLARAAPMVRRLAVIYSVLDCAGEVEVPHLKAALAVWQYAEASARYVFAGRLGDPTADTCLDALKRAPEGLTREQIYVEVFGRHKSASEIGRALQVLRHHDLAAATRVQTGGRPAEIWRAA